MLLLTYALSTLPCPELEEVMKDCLSKHSEDTENTFRKQNCKENCFEMLK